MHVYVYTLHIHIYTYMYIIPLHVNLIYTKFNYISHFLYTFLYLFIHQEYFIL